MKVNESIFKSSLLQISAKNCETFVQFFSFVLDIFIISTLAVCPWLPNIHPCLGSFDCILVYCFISKFLYFLLGNFQGSCCHFSENKSKNLIVFSVVMVTLLYHLFFAFITLLRKMVILSVDEIFLCLYYNSENAWTIALVACATVSLLVWQKCSLFFILSSFNSLYFTTGWIWTEGRRHFKRWIHWQFH